MRDRQRSKGHTPAHLQAVDGVVAQRNLDVRLAAPQHDAHAARHLAQRRALQPRLDEARRVLVAVALQRHLRDANNKGAQRRRRVDARSVDARWAGRQMHPRQPCLSPIPPRPPALPFQHRPAPRAPLRTFMMGVEMFLAALMISLMRGTPSVTFMLATPAKWNVFSVICVPGSPAQVERGGRWAWV